MLRRSYKLRTLLRSSGPASSPKREKRWNPKTCCGDLYHPEHLLEKELEVRGVSCALTSPSAGEQKKRLKLSLLTPGVALRCRTFGLAAMELVLRFALPAAAHPVKLVKPSKLPQIRVFFTEKIPGRSLLRVLIQLSSTHVYESFQIAMSVHVMVQALTQFEKWNGPPSPSAGCPTLLLRSQMQAFLLRTFPLLLQTCHMCFLLRNTHLKLIQLITVFRKWSLPRKEFLKTQRLQNRLIVRRSWARPRVL